MQSPPEQKGGFCPGGITRQLKGVIWSVGDEVTGDLSLYAIVWFFPMTNQIDVFSHCLFAPLNRSMRPARHVGRHSDIAELVEW